MRPLDRVVISAEHASDAVPRRYAALFAGRRKLLASHRGIDFGTGELAQRLAGELGARLFLGRHTRLLVDLNRSPGRRDLFSEVSRALPEDERQRVLARYYLPYRAVVEREVREGLRGRRVVVHLSVHSFTPRWHGKPRHAAVGLLYDPARLGEVQLCRAWQAALRVRCPELRVRRNYPYRGVADGLVTFLRRRLQTARYLGIELEVNQSYPCGERGAWLRLQELLVVSLHATLALSA